MTPTLPEAQRKALLVRATALLQINEPCRIVIDATGHDVDELRGNPIRIIFEPPGVIRVYEKLTGGLLAESEPGQLEKPAGVPRR